jgi:hypothetical protein
LFLYFYKILLQNTFTKYFYKILLQNTFTKYFYKILLQKGEEKGIEREGEGRG